MLQGPLQHRAEQSSIDWCSLSLRTGPCWEDEPSEPYNYFHGFISVHFLKMSFRDTELASHECCECQHSSLESGEDWAACIQPCPRFTSEQQQRVFHFPSRKAMSSFHFICGERKMKITKAKVSPCTSPRASVRNRIAATKLSQEALSACDLWTF